MMRNFLHDKVPPFFNRLDDEKLFRVTRCSYSISCSGLPRVKNAETAGFCMWDDRYEDQLRRPRVFVVILPNPV